MTGLSRQSHCTATLSSRFLLIVSFTPILQEIQLIPVEFEKFEGNSDSDKGCTSFWSLNEFHCTNYIT